MEAGVSIWMESLTGFYTRYGIIAFHHDVWWPLKSSPCNLHLWYRRLSICSNVIRARKLLGPFEYKINIGIVKTIWLERARSHE